MRPTGWRWFCAWAVAGGLLAFALLSGASIGFLMLPFAAIAVWLVGRTARMWPEILGSLAGAGALCLAVAAANRDYVACPDGPITLGPGEDSFSCGGLDPLPWLVVGVVLLVAGPALYALARRRGPPRFGRPLSTGEKLFLSIVLVLAAFSFMVLAADLTTSTGVEISGSSSER
jgi:hypothetical protein